MGIKLDYDREYSGRFTVVEIGDAQLYFSCKVLIGIWIPGHTAMVAANIWSNTTGRHIGMVKNRHETVTVSSQVLNDIVDGLLNVNIDLAGELIDAYVTR